jgi:hypothetical protein
MSWVDMTIIPGMGGHAHNHLLVTKKELSRRLVWAGKALSETVPNKLLIRLKE